MSTTVNYTITNFNEAEKQLDVIFDDGGWAKIQLKAPLPSTQEELEAVIKQFTSPVEVMQAKTATTDLSYISDLINKSIQITRISNVQNIPNNNKVTATPTSQQIKNTQIRRQYALAEQLVTLGVLATNPVDLTQIIEDTTTVVQPISTGTQII